MKFCSKCGHELVDEAVVCVNCGCSVADPATPAAPAAPAVADAPNIGFAILGFFIPLVGLILYLMNKDTAPLKAKSAGKGALIGFIVNLVSSIVFGIIYGVLMSSLLGGAMMY